MPKKKKTKSKHGASKTATARRAKKSAGVKQARRPAKTVKKKPSKKKTSLKTSLPGKRKALRSRAQRMESSQNTENAVPARQSIDFQGLSRAQQADSESVEELVEEGNVFEAGAVAGVQKADDEDTREVHTREVPENDVPDEYLDKD